MSANKLILFDIDGTLLAPGPAGRKTLDKCIGEFTGKLANLEFEHVAGSTDPIIVRDALVRLNGSRNIDTNLVTAILKRYVDIIQSVLPGNGEVKILPGSRDLVEACKNANWTVAILTGNMKISAFLKLGECGLVDEFAFGVYGEDGNRRDDLPWIARERAFEITGTAFSFEDMVLIGDTPSDARIAHRHAMPSLIVCRRTDKKWRQMIIDEQPTWLVDDLCQTEKLLNMIKGNRE